jgi:hypothetical protein
MAKVAYWISQILAPLYEQGKPVFKLPADYETMPEITLRKWVLEQIIKLAPANAENIAKRINIQTSDQWQSAIKIYAARYGVEDAPGPATAPAVAPPVPDKASTPAGRDYRPVIPAQAEPAPPTAAVEEEPEPEPETPVLSPEPEVRTYYEAENKAVATPGMTTMCIEDNISVKNAMNKFFEKVKELVTTWEMGLPENERLFTDKEISTTNMALIPLSGTVSMFPYVYDIGSEKLCLPLPKGWGVTLTSISLPKKTLLSLVAMRKSSPDKGNIPTFGYPPFLKFVKGYYNKLWPDTKMKFGEPVGRRQDQENASFFQCLEHEDLQTYMNSVMRRI